jgi:hypothetical protein
MRLIMIIFSIAVVVIVVVLGNDPVALGQETQAQPPSVPSLPPLSIQAPFIEQEFAPYEKKKKKGTASISGQAFITRGNKEVRFQPGGDVMLVPESPYTREWFENYVQKQGSCVIEPSAEATLSKDQKECGLPHHIFALFVNDKRLFPYLRFTRTSPTGHFWFNKVPSGRYFIVAVITWEAAFNIPVSGGLAWASVEAEQGEQVANVMVTR